MTTQPTEIDRELAQAINIGNGCLCGIHNATSICLRHRDIAQALANARAEQRAEDAALLTQLADKASMEETNFDAIGEPCLEPQVKYWEGQRVALRAATDAILDPSSGLIYEARIRAEIAEALTAKAFTVAITPTGNPKAVWLDDVLAVIERSGK